MCQCHDETHKMSTIPVKGDLIEAGVMSAHLCAEFKEEHIARLHFQEKQSTT